MCGGSFSPPRGGVARQETLFPLGEATHPGPKNAFPSGHAED